MKRFASFLRRNSFVLVLLLAFAATDLAVAKWDPLKSSLRFYKNDFTKTLYHHNWADAGPVFFGNSAVTGAYMEDKSKHPLVEMGLSYGSINDLKGILQNKLYRVQGELVIGIDIHTMVDKMPTEPSTDSTYPWLKKWYQPYLFAYRDYLKDSGEEALRSLYTGTVELDRSKLLAYTPRWIDKELYFGRKPDDFLKERWNFYNEKFGAMTMDDFRQNLDALQYVMQYAAREQIPLRVVWMPYNKAYPEFAYMKPLKAEVNKLLEANRVPVFDAMGRYEPQYFHDLVHLNREDGAPLFTKEVDEWLESLAKPSKS
ncbi:hypothetical protein [Paenibacillus sp. MBLB4367]|uniref:hypothetical protein n=1 Tax=Paenibacillus sp. MBLB4367 TaxID=3384767 RepID=UPI003907EB0F